jgi:hypothetical protein
VRRRAWQNLLAGGVLAGACREAIDAGDAPAVTEGWDRLARAEVAALVRATMRPPIKRRRLLGDVRGTLAVARAAVAAREYDLPSLALWVHEAAAAWGGGRGRRRLTAAVPWQRGVEPQTVLDEHFLALARLDAGWRVGAARDCARLLLGLDRRPAVRARKLWLLGYKAPRGFPLRLHVELLGDGRGEFYADPASLGLVPFTNDFIKAVTSAWKLARDQAGVHPMAAISMR